MTTEHRAGNRTMYARLEDGLDAMRIHDTSARQVVRDFVNELLTAPEYRDAFDLDRATGGTEFTDLLAMGHLRLWTTPSMQYLAIGGRLVTAIDDPVDGYEVIARAYRARLVADSVLRYSPLRLIHGKTIPYPNSVTQQRAPRGTSARAERLVAVCPRCFEVLPATGVCDTCG